MSTATTTNVYSSTLFTRHNDSLVADASELGVAPGQVPHDTLGTNHAVRGVIVAFPDGTMVAFVYTGVNRNTDGDTTRWEYHRGGVVHDGVRAVVVYND